jgi:hypothetical protein
LIKVVEEAKLHCRNARRAPWQLSGASDAIEGSSRPIKLFIPGSRFFVLSKTSACENLDSGDVRIEVTQLDYSEIKVFCSGKERL